jgi:hypothetical protein
MATSVALCRHLGHSWAFGLHMVYFLICVPFGLHMDMVGLLGRTFERCWPVVPYDLIVRNKLKWKIQGQL